MLASMRTTAHSLFMKLLMGLLVISFAVWGVGDVVRSGNTSYLIKVGDERVTYQQFLRAVSDTQRMLQQMGMKNVDRRMVEAQVLRRLTEEKIVTLALRDAGLDVNQQLLAQRLRANQAFHDVRGNFDPAAFKAMLAQRNQSEAAFLEELKTDLRASALTSSLSTLDMAAPSAVAALVQASQNERRDALVLTIPASKVKFDAPSDAALQDYYTANASQLYLQPEARTLEYVRFSGDALKEKVAASITDADLRERYESEPDRFVDEAGNSKPFDAVKKEIRAELLAERTDTAAADVTIAVEDALAAGKSMGEAIADAGIATRSTLLKNVTAAQFEASKDALLRAVAAKGFTLEQDETSGLEVAEDGSYYMVAAKEVVAATPKAFDAVKDDVKKRATDRARAKALRAYANEVKAKLDASKDITATAKELGLGVRNVSNLSRPNGAPNAGSPLSPSLTEALFTYDQGGIAGPLVEPDKAEFAQVKAIRFLPVDKKQTDILAKGLGQAIQQEVLMGYYGALIQRYPVTLNEGLLKQLQAQSSGEGDGA